MNEEKKEYLLQLVEERRYQQLMRELDNMNEVDIADFLEEISLDKAIVIFRMLKKDVSTDIFSELPSEIQEQIIAGITDMELSVLIEELAADDAVDMLEELPDKVVKRVLRNAKPGTRKIINQILNYPEDSAGSIMTAEYLSIRRNYTVAKAMEYIRNHGMGKETVYTCYVTDASGVLDGVVSFRDLLFAEDEDIIENIMEEDVIFAYTTDDKEEVVNQISKYGFLAMPIVDKAQRLVGMVTYDDAVDVLEEETTEDFEKMAAIQPSERPYLKSSVFTLARQRIVWLLVLMISAMLSGKILNHYEAVFASIPLLVTFIPMLTGTGGNAGSQTSTMIIRGMAVQEIDPKKDWLQVLWKELRISLLIGGGLALINYVRLVISYPGKEMICLTVVASLLITVVVAKTIGCLLPMIAKQCNADPALMASPLITTIVDCCSLFIYFSIAQRLMDSF
ncbi:MAG: magnesium transporter [Lachnospiraceae bacterium]